MVRRLFSEPLAAEGLRRLRRVLLRSTRICRSLICGGVCRLPIRSCIPIERGLRLTGGVDCFDAVYVVIFVMCLNFGCVACGSLDSGCF